MGSEFTVGQIFSKSFDIFAKNFPFMLLVAFFAVLPTSFFQLAPESLGLLLGGMLVYFLMYFILQGVVVYGVFQHLTSQKMVFAESLNVALGRFLPLLVVSFAVGIITSIGYLLLIIPGVILYLMFWVAVPVTIVEKGGVGHSLQRSRDLTTGYRGRIFSVVFVLGFMGVILGLLQGGLSAMFNSGGMAPGSAAFVLTSLLVSMMTTGLTSALSSVVVTVGYYTLRHEVDGVATEDLAAVFE